MIVPITSIRHQTLCWISKSTFLMERALLRGGTWICAITHVAAFKLVDAATMHLLSRPADFDVVLADNLFGDILTDEASMLTGSIGMIASACLGDDNFGVYEPIHGSAPDIQGKGIANPCGMILSLSMLLRHSLELNKEALAIEQAIHNVLNDGIFTADLSKTNTVSTSTMGDKIVQEI